MIQRESSTETMVHHGPRLIPLGSGQKFSGATLYRPKDDVLLVVDPHMLFGSKSQYGWSVVRELAESENRALVLFPTVCEWSPSQYGAWLNQLKSHGLIAEVQ